MLYVLKSRIYNKYVTYDENDDGHLVDDIKEAKAVSFDEAQRIMGKWYNHTYMLEKLEEEKVEKLSYIVAVSTDDYINEFDGQYVTRDFSFVKDIKLAGEFNKEEVNKHINSWTTSRYKYKTVPVKEEKEMSNVGNVVTFVYNGGSDPGSTRLLEVVNDTNTVLSGTDHIKGEYRCFKKCHISGDIKVVAYNINGDIKKCEEKVEEAKSKKIVLIADLVKSLKKVTYKPGQHFMTNGGDCILAQTGYDYCCLLCLSDGNRMRDPIQVNDSDEVTKEEMNKMCSEWSLIK